MDILCEIAVFVTFILAAFGGGILADLLHRRAIIKADPAQRTVFPLIRIWRDDSIPAFGGWAAGSLKDGEGVILLNVATCFLGGVDEQGNRVEMTTEDSKWLAITTLMHEFGHACQEFFALEFTEEQIEKIVADYEEGFRTGRYNVRHANDGTRPD